MCSCSNCCCKWQSSCVYVALLKRKSQCFFSKDAPISVSMQKSGLNKRKCGIVCLFYLSVFILTLSSPNERWTYRCLCPGLHQCSLAFRNCVFRWGEWGGGRSGTHLLPPCTLARFPLWQHVARGPVIILLSLLACGHRISLHNHVNQQSPQPKAVQIHLMSLLLR